MMRVQPDYAERVYAGVLGKIIGVYLGRPFEGWTYERIMQELGEIRYYVHEKLGKRLIVTDDDISGTFAFLRAMPDYGNRLDLTAAQIGQTWLNYLIEGRTVLWWGGLGNSTEHTAYLRLKAGIPAPCSGSIALNGQVVAEQIGAQIFIDGWGMIAPGDPQLAADLARRAASVSHDGEAIFAAQVIAAMEAQAFVEPDIDTLLDVGVSLIPQTSLIYRLIADLRDWRARHDDWRAAFRLVQSHYGYDKYGGNCHMVPNHALIILALLYCEDRFHQALTIVNTAGWDTDCNSGNVGCLMGIKNGLAGLDSGPDLRGPVADRLYLPTADGGRAVSDALHESDAIVQIARALSQQPAPLPKEGARFHFDMPGAVQGFIVDEAVECRGVARLENIAGHSHTGQRSLAIRYHGLCEGRHARILRETYPDFAPTQGYMVAASPTLYPGQILRARLSADIDNRAPVQAAFILKVWDTHDQLALVRSPQTPLRPGQSETLAWRVEAPVGCPIAWMGLELASAERADGALYLDWLTWEGSPTVQFEAPAGPGARWLQAWVQACSAATPGRSDHTYRLIQNEGQGMLIQGAREWRDYSFSAQLTPHLARSVGIAVRVQGLRRYYALKLLADGMAQLVRELDGTHVLAETPHPWELYRTYALSLSARGDTLMGSIDGVELFSVQDKSLLDGGAVALLIEEGRLGADAVRIEALA